MTSKTVPCHPIPDRQGRADELARAIPESTIEALRKKQPWTQSFSGRAIRILDPSPDQVDILDIAHALSNVCRFGGMTLSHYSVAQHSVLVSANVSEEHALAGLLHDAAEAYIGDIVTPLKRALTMHPYRVLEKAWARAISERFGVELVKLPEEVVTADLRALLTEKRDLLEPMLSGQPEWTMFDGLEIEPFDRKIVAVTPAEAKAMFLREWRALGGE